MTKTDDIPGQAFASVWGALKEAMRRLDVTQLRVIKALRGRLGKFSPYAFIMMAKPPGLKTASGSPAPPALP